MADRKHLGRRIHGDIGVNDAIDPVAGDDGARAGAIERRDEVGLSPQLRNERDHETGAMRGQNRECELDGICQLNRDHGMRREAGLDEMRRQGGDCLVGLRIGQPFRRLTGDLELVERVDQGHRIRVACQDPLEQSLKRR